LKLIATQGGMFDFELIEISLNSQNLDQALM